MIKRQIILLLFFVFCAIQILNAQENKMVVLNLKTGYSIKGEIIEQTAQGVKIKTLNGEIIEYKANEINSTMDAKLSSTSKVIKFGVKAGLNLSNILVKDNDDTYSDNFKMKPGFHIGATAEFPIDQMISFETGLLLSTKGYKTKEEQTFGGETYTYKGSMNLLYLDIPLNAKAYFDAGGLKVYGAFGPYLGFGLSGKAKHESSGMGSSDSGEDDVKWGSGDNDDFKRLDFGLTLGAGVEINSIQLGLSYNLGLANISAYTDNGAKAKNRVIGISVGYMFGGE